MTWWSNEGHRVALVVKAAVNDGRDPGRPVVGIHGRMALIRLGIALLDGVRQGRQAVGRHAGKNIGVEHWWVER